MKQKFEAALADMKKIVTTAERGVMAHKHRDSIIEALTTIISKPKFFVFFKNSNGPPTDKITPASLAAVVVVDIGIMRLEYALDIDKLQKC